MKICKKKVIEYKGIELPPSNCSLEPGERGVGHTITCHEYFFGSIL